jgi:hypothetical protein
MLRNENATTSNKKTSPILLKPIAENADEVVRVRECQVPIRRKLMRPTISQENKTKNKPDELSTNQTARRNETSLKAKPEY